MTCSLFPDSESRCLYATRITTLLDSQFAHTGALPHYLIVPKAWTREIQTEDDYSLPMADRVACGDILALVANYGWRVARILTAGPDSEFLSLRLERES